MKDASLRLFRFKYKLPSPISIATYTWTHLETILVNFQYGELSGIGEAAPFALMTGETYDYVLSQLQNFRHVKLDPEAAADIFYQQIENNIKSSHAAAALDGAFHDLLGKMGNQPVYKLFGDKKNLTPNSLTIPILGVEETRKLAIRILEDYPQVKLIKIKLDNDLINTEIAKTLKEVFSENVSYVIDPNQCFKDPKQAIQILQEMQSILGNIIAVEQPVEKHDYQGLLEIKNGLNGINIFADESVVGMEDLEKIISMNAVDGINIKIQKAGGIWNAKRMAHRANQAGLKVMVGCMIEGPIGIAAGIHFAVSTPNVTFTDLDSDLLLFQDFKPAMFSTSPFINGIRSPFETSGLGIEINQSVIDKFVRQNEIVYEEI